VIWFYAVIGIMLIPGLGAHDHGACAAQTDGTASARRAHQSNPKVWYPANRIAGQYFAFAAC
jgi:hypothetical protein